jgi:protease I
MFHHLSGKRILIVVAPEKFRDEELAEPKKVFEEAGAEVTLASTRPGPATGMLGARVAPQLIVEDAVSRDWDAVVVVGGTGSQQFLWDHAPLHSLLRKQVALKGIVGAICLSGAVLGKSGVAQGKRATCWPDPAAVAALRAGGATYQAADVVVDGNLVTADGPTSARKFGETVARALQA